MSLTAANVVHLIALILALVCFGAAALSKFDKAHAIAWGLVVLTVWALLDLLWL
jgi:hypothetical protein